MTTTTTEEAGEDDENEDNDEEEEGDHDHEDEEDAEDDEVMMRVIVRARMSHAISRGSPVPCLRHLLMPRRCRCRGRAGPARGGAGGWSARPLSMRQTESRD